MRLTRCQGLPVKTKACCFSIQSREAMLSVGALFAHVRKCSGFAIFTTSPTGVPCDGGAGTAGPLSVLFSSVVTDYGINKGLLTRFHVFFILVLDPRCPAFLVLLLSTFLFKAVHMCEGYTQYRMGFGLVIPLQPGTRHQQTKTNVSFLSISSETSFSFCSIYSLKKHLLSVCSRLWG